MFPDDSNLEAKFTFETGDTPVDEQPPFHILILGNWSGDGAKNALTRRHPISIDRDNFDEVIGKLGVALRLDLSDDAQTTLDIEFNELEDFHPDNLYRRLPIFAHLRSLRQKLSQPDTFDAAAREVRSWSNQTELSPTPIESPRDQTAVSNSDNLLDSILAQTGDASSAVNRTVSRSSDLDRLISNIVSPFVLRVDENEQSELISFVDQAISETMRRILHHTSFQNLEARWRGLYFLVRRVETDLDLKIFIFDLTKPEMTDNLKSVSSLAESELYRVLIGDTIETAGGQPWAVVGASYSFGVNVDDVSSLIRLAKLSAAAQAPFISYIRPEMFGIDSFAHAGDLSEIKFDAGSDQGKLWSTLRTISESNYLGLSPMRILARLPYGETTESLETFNFEEFVDEPGSFQYLWTNPCFAIIYLLAGNYRRFGWEFGSMIELDINGLPFFIQRSKCENKPVPCAEIVLTEKFLNQLLENGLLPLVSFRDSDRVRVSRFQSVSDKQQTINGLWVG